ncbi:glycosyltransferase [Microbacterium enclense]|uniref:glycosyltransferase n=1 Tax=Microbacterium enclense TaxID=993073 RepID=UPI0021A580B4|nr:glycosyltransferase [Microbacterium enclense]MCT2085758.1 glycosyltransferase [Microbacterium enclense]
MTDTSSPESRADVAIAHDYLTQRGGAEKVVLALQRAFPKAPIYTTLYQPETTYPEFAASTIVTSPLNRIPLLRRSHRLALPFLAWAAGRTRVDAKHTIVSSSGWAHGFPTTGSKIVYCYSPARWLYQRDAYLGTSKVTLTSVALRVLSPFLKRWDRRASRSATKYFAISTVVQRRIQETYGIDSEVLPAPHSVDMTIPQEPVDLGPLEEQQGLYLCISRLLPYKNVDVVIEAFNVLGLPLVVVGAGPEERRLSALAGPNVVMVKDLTDGQIQWLYARSIAVVSSSYEDFGLTPIEGATHGKPSIVLRWGGFLDTILEDRTGVYFDEPTPEALSAAVTRFQASTWDEETIRRHADLFTEEHFARRLRDEIDRLDAASDRGTGMTS